MNYLMYATYFILGCFCGITLISILVVTRDEKLEMMEQEEYENEKKKYSSNHKIK